MALCATALAGLADDYASALGTGLWPSLDVLPEPERGRRGVSLDPASALW